MSLRHLVFLLGLSMLAVLLPVAPALADAIDGDWCFSDGRHISIDGPDIVTPAGTPTTGDYGRHSFLYTVPDAEAGAGRLVTMILLNENTVQLTTSDGASGSARSPIQIWQRCFPVTS